MKLLPKIRILLVSMLLPLSLFSQNSVIILEYMKVEPGNEQLYREVEQEWRKIHQKKIGLGISNGWQLWRNVYAGSDDPYQYVTINWYKDVPQSFEENFPADFLDGLFSQEEFDNLMEKTQISRKLVAREMNHLQMQAKGSKRSNVIVIFHFQVPEGGEGNYLSVENEFWRPRHEKSIELGYRTSWGVWSVFPFKEGQARYIAVDGYASPEQMMTEQQNLSGKIKEPNWEEALRKTGSARATTSTEIWQLVDSVFPGN